MHATRQASADSTSYEERIGRGLPSADVVYGNCRGLPSGKHATHLSTTPL